MNSFGKRIWLKYDRLGGEQRFIIFFVFIAVPFSLLMGTCPLLGLGYASLIILWRFISVNQIKKED